MMTKLGGLFWFSIVLLLIPLSVSARGAGEPASERMLNFALAGNPDTLDPHATAGTLTFQVLRSVYDTLVEPDREGRIVPALAEEWQVSDDGLIWSFRLRQGVRFHNGERFGAQDVKATLERLVAVGAPFADDFSIIKSIETPADDMVIVRLSEPHAPLLASLASGWGAILPRSAIDAGHDFARSPIGTGPFRLEEWLPDSRILLRRNPDYWIAGAPKIDGVIMHILIESAVRVQGLLSGDIDIVYLLDEEQIPLLEEHPDTRVTSFLGSLVLVLAMNTSRPPLDNQSVRQAITQSIDKQRTMDIAYGGGEVIGSFIDFSSPYYSDFTGIYPYNVERARRLLQESDIDEETTLEIVLPQNFAPHVRAGELYQQMLSEIGLKTTLRLVDWSTWLNEIYGSAEYDLTVIGHTGRLDPDTRFQEYGYVRWENSRVDELREAARSASTFDERSPLYTEAFEIMAREAPFVYVGTAYRHVGLRSGIEGFSMDTTLDTFDFRSVEIR